MKTSPVVHIAACCSLVSGTLLLGTGNTLAQKDVADWEIRIGRDHRSQAIQARVGYELMNLTAQQVIKYGDRTDGINLVWDRNVGLANVKFEQDPPHPDGLIYEGQAIAIHVLNGGYLRYGERTEGINLVWSQSPVYEWQIMHSVPPEPRDKVQSLVRIVLYNTKTQDYVIYCERPYGINLRWAKDCK